MSRKYILFIISLLAAVSCTTFDEGMEVGSSAFSVYPTSISVDQYSGFSDLEVSSGQRWSVSSKPSWVTVHSVIAADTPFKWNVSLSFDANSGRERNDKLVIKNDNGKTIDVPLYQRGAQVSVQGVRLDESYLSIYPGTSTKFVAIIEPDDAYNQSVTWKCQPTGIISLSPDGLMCDITALKPGIAELSVVTSDGGYSAACVVEVVSVIVFKDGTVRKLCLDHWDTNYDSQLSYEEAAAVKTLGSVFTGKDTITSFEELQYFTGLTSIEDNAFNSCLKLSEVTLPSTVTSIGEQAFFCSGLKRIDIPYSVTKIGDAAFSVCDNLESFSGKFATADGRALIVDGRLKAFARVNLSGYTIPITATSIGDLAFYGCSDLRNVTFHSKLTEIGAYAFQGCSGLNEIQIPENVKKIYDGAFKSCYNLASIEILAKEPPAGGSNMFQFSYCPIYVPNGTVKTYKAATYWSDYADRITSREMSEIIKFADSLVKSLCVARWDKNGDGELSKGEADAVTFLTYGFQDESIKSFDELQYFTSLTTIESQAFRGCKSLTSITMPESVKNVNSRAFEGCTSLGKIGGPYATSDGRALIINNVLCAFAPAGLTSYTVPSEATSILSAPFYGCTGLNAVVLHSGIRQIGEYAFYGCTGLNSVDCEAAEPPTGGTDMFYKTNNCPIYVPEASVNKYKTAQYWSNYSNRITYRDNSSFIDFADQTTKGICVSKWDKNGDGELSMDEAAAVESIGTMFRYTSIKSFDELQYFTGLKSIDTYAFETCTSLTSISIPGSVTSVGNRAFVGCTSLKIIGGPNATSDGRALIINKVLYAFAPAGLAGYTIPSAATSIMSAPFYGCTGLTSVVLHSGIKQIGEYAFRGCSGLTSIECEATEPPTGGLNMFTATNDCPIYVPEASYNKYKTAQYWSTYASRITYHDDSAIIDFADQTTKNICVSNWDKNGDGNLSKGEAAAVGSISTVFRNKSIKSFDEFQFFTGVKDILSYAFQGCASLQSITIPSGVENFGERTFESCSSLSVFSGKYASADGRAIIQNGTLLAFAPANIEEYTIPSAATRIGIASFYGCNKLKRVVMHSAISNIGGSAFYNCTSLQSIECEAVNPPSGGGSMFSYTNNCPIYVPAGSVNAYKTATYWSNYASRIYAKDTSNYINFADSKVKSLCVANWDTNSDGNISESEAAAVKNLGSVFTGQPISSFNELSYFTGLNSISAQAFEGCTSLKKITIPSTVTSISSRAFHSCAKLTDIQMPDGITTFGSTVFAYCTDLKNITLPANLNTLGTAVFDNCTSLKSVDFPAGVTEIKAQTFNNCSSLYSVSLHAGITGIGSSAFTSCTSLSSITIPEAVTSIEDETFRYCSALKTVTIPANVTKIGKNAFRDCTGMMSFECLPTNPPTGATQMFDNTNECPIYVPSGTVNTYKNASYWKSYANRIQAKDSSSSIQFADSKVKSICVSNWDTNGDGQLSTNEAAAVKNLGTVFQGQGISKFNELQYFTGLTNIPSQAFASCSALTSVVVPNGVIEIGTEAFAMCSSLKSVNLPNTLQNIASWAFYRCVSLTSFTVPTSVVSIGAGVFGGCTSLQMFYGNYVASNGRVLVKDNKLLAFAPSGLTSFTVPSGVTEIWNCVFESCSSLTSVYLPSSLKTLMTMAFYKCTSLTSISLPTSLQYIYNQAFGDCTALTSIELPASILSIGESAFNGCTGLASIECKATTPPTGGQYMFSNTNNCPIYVPAASLNSYKSATYWKDYSARIQAKGNSSNIQFADALVKQICVANWDTNGDGELSMTEAAAVTSLGTVFGGTSISKFNELQYFTGLTDITGHAFEDCSSLTSVIVPSGVTKIGDEAFAACTSLTTVNLPNTLQNISGWAFYMCSSLTSFTIPTNVTSIGFAAFGCCTSLQTFYGNYVTSNGRALVKDNKLLAVATNGLTSFTVPSGITEIGGFAFAYCTSLKSVYLPSSLKTVAFYAFEGCSSLSSITLPDGLQYIEGEAFRNCTALKSVELPSSLLGIDYEAFRGCTGLSSIECLATNPPSGGNSMFDGTNDCPIYVPAGSVSSYKNAKYWANYSARIQAKGSSSNISFTDANVKSICVSNWDTNGDGELSMTEAAAVTDLGTVFKENKTISKFNELQYFTGLTSISDSAFSECTALTTVTLPENVLQIGPSAFYSCSGLTSITLPSKLVSIENNAFLGCSSLGSITFPSTLQSIQYNAFALCSSLKSVSLPNSVTFIGTGLFAGCTGLQSFTGKFSSNGRFLINDGCVIAFAPSGLTSCSIPYGATSIDANTFFYCENLVAVDLPSTLKSIYSYAFSECHKLESLVIPSAVTNIYGYAFDDCWSLSYVRMKGSTPPSLGTNVFNNSPGCPIYVPSTAYNTYLSQWSSLSSRIVSLTEADYSWFIGSWNVTTTHSSDPSKTSSYKLIIKAKSNGSTYTVSGIDDTSINVEAVYDSNLCSLVLYSQSIGNYNWAGTYLPTYLSGRYGNTYYTDTYIVLTGTRSGNNYMLLTPGAIFDNNYTEVKFSRFGFCGVSQTDGVWSYTYQAELPQTIAKTSSNAPAQPASAGSVVKTAKTAPKVVVSKKAKAGKPDARRFLETAGKLQKR